MIIHSPIHSFVDFEDRLQGWALPVVDFYEPAFQLLFENGSVGWSDVLKVQLYTADKSDLLVDLDTTVGVVNNICSWCTITGIPPNENTYPLTVNYNQIIPAGSYADIEAVYAAFKVQGLNAAAGRFLHCCSHGNKNRYVIGTSAGSIIVDFKKGLQYVTFLTDVMHPDLFDPVTMNSCFRYCIYNVTQDERIFSNVFIRVPNARNLMIVRYSSNEDSYDFKYPIGVENIVYLPLKVQNPQYPEKRKVYKKSNQHYKVLSASIEKEYELITDHLPDLIHDRITVMLAHDNLHFDADNISSDVAKRESDEYSIEWPADVIWGDALPVAQGKGKISIPFEGRNSNCEQRPVCSFTLLHPPVCHPVGIAGTIHLPDAQVGEVYAASVQLTGDTPFTISDFVGPEWMTAEVEDDNVILSGTPDEEATGIAISFTVHNCAMDTIDYTDTIDVDAANGTHWANDEEVDEDNPTLQSWHDVDIIGKPGETVTVTVSDYSNDFGGVITFNGVSVTAIGNTFSLLIGGSGNSGTIQVRLQGLPVSFVGHPYGMLARFTITAATGGSIGTPSDFQISKAFS